MQRKMRWLENEKEREKMKNPRVMGERPTSHKLPFLSHDFSSSFPFSLLKLSHHLLGCGVSLSLYRGSKLGIGAFSSFPKYDFF